MHKWWWKSNNLNCQKNQKNNYVGIKKEDIIIFKFNIGIIEVNLRENLELKIPKLMMATKISSEYKDSNPIIYKEELPEAVIFKKSKQNLSIYT